MALTFDEQKFYDFAKAALPDWIPDPDEFLHGAAKMFGGVKALIDYLFGNALIGGALGTTPTTPDWLNQHARDRGTARQDGETDEALRQRLRDAPDALTRIAILQAIDAVLEANGVSEDSALVELPRHGAHSGEYVSDAGVGGTFVQAGAVARFTPDAGWARPPFWAPALVPGRTTRLVTTLGAWVNNQGTFSISALDGDAVVITNPTGVSAVDPAVAWEVQTMDAEGNVRDGFTRSYSQRGYRSARLLPMRLVVILPYGTTAQIEASVREAMRTKKAAGIAVTIERRTIAP